MEVRYYISSYYQKQPLESTYFYIYPHQCHWTLLFHFIGNYRYGFATPPNYNDHELYCGGFTRQWRDNSGKCGICGDPWNTKQVIYKIKCKQKINIVTSRIQLLIQCIYFHVLLLAGICLFCNAVEFEFLCLSRIKTNKINVTKQKYAWWRNAYVRNCLCGKT